MNSMTNVVAIMKIVKITIFEFVIQLIINHFGINPIKGGIPPNDKKFSIRQNLIDFC